MGWLDAVILGIVEGLTEYLPVSSTGHLTITEKLLGLQIDNPTVTGYTATIQLGAIAATLLFFRKKILNLLVAFFTGVRDRQARTSQDWTMALAVIVGSIPVGLVGFALRNVIEGPLRSLWVVAGALIAWSFAMWISERRYSKAVASGTERGESDIRVLDGLLIGLIQCFSLVPGVSRSGATISAGLFFKINRVLATELSFFLAIPALTAAGVYGLKDVNFDVIPLGSMIIGIGVSFVVAYASIAWLLKFVASNSLMAFIIYRIVLGTVLLVVLGTGAMSAT